MPDLSDALADALADLDAARRDVFAALDAFPPDQRAVRPADDAWSADDVAEHLMRTERGFVVGLERQIAAGDARRDVGPPSAEALAILVDRLLRADFRYRMPGPAAPYITPTGLDPDEVRAEWGALAARLCEIAGTFPPELAGVGLLRHPVIGAMDAAGTLRFAAAHLRHHQHQLDRIAASDALRTASGS